MPMLMVPASPQPSMQSLGYMWDNKIGNFLNGVRIPTHYNYGCCLCRNGPLYYKMPVANFAQPEHPRHQPFIFYPKWGSLCVKRHLLFRCCFTGLIRAALSATLWPHSYPQCDTAAHPAAGNPAIYQKATECLHDIQEGAEAHCDGWAQHQGQRHSQFNCGPEGKSCLCHSIHTTISWRELLSSS